jgi:VanZ family protein
MTVPLRFCYLGAAWISVVALAVLSLLPRAHMIRTDLGGHVEHVLAYAGTAFMVACSYGPKKWPNIAAGLITYAGVLELLQRFSPGRTPSISDFAFSATGVLVGLALIAVAGRIIPRTGS